MDSSTKPSLLTKLLRPDKKVKQQPAEDDKRRYSAPVYGWWEVDPITVTSDNQLKPQKQKQKNKHSSQQNLSSPKKQKTTKTKSTGSKEKRKSTARSSWFCMSGNNADTLDRSLMPVQNTSKNAKTSDKKKDKNNAVPVPVDILRQNGGKKIRDNKNRHSAPIPDWSTARTPDNSQSHQTNQQEPANKSQKDSPPGVRYRFDGTLEKPYVFPAGLTFGPEGRKLNLRRSSHSQLEDKPPIIPPRLTEKVVKVEVHKSSTEDIIMEYSYEESEPDPSDFDVRKAFFLKYDSNMPDSIDNKKLAGSGLKQTDSHRSSVLGGQKQESRWKPKESTTNASQRSSRRQLRAERSKSRYSMPLKNEHFVYMGSCENLSMSNQVEHESRMAQSSVDISSNLPTATNDGKKIDRRNRYSTPIKNTDFVYMGSFENINQLINLDNSSGFSLPNADVGERNNKSLDASTCLSDNNNKSAIVSKNSAKQPPGTQHGEFRKQSLTNLAVVSGSSLTNISNNMSGFEVTSGRQDNRKHDIAKLAVSSGSSLTNTSNKTNSYKNHKDTSGRHEDSRHSSNSSENPKDTSGRHEDSRHSSNSSKNPKDTSGRHEDSRHSSNSSENPKDTTGRHEDSRHNSTNIAVASGSNLSTVSIKTNGYEKNKHTSMRQEERRQSLTNLAVASGSNLKDINNITSSVDHQGFENDDEEYDRFDDSFLSNESTRSCPQENPFSRRGGRTSYNPGNSRAFVPPPAIITTSLSSTTTTPFSVNLSRLSFMPGNKPFSIPPPPSYTPPKEEKDYSFAHRTDTKCNRDSQTDLSTEFDNLNMEDRDSSLKLAEVKTIFAGISFRNKDGTIRAPTESPKHILKNYDSHFQGRKITTVTSFFDSKPNSATIDMPESTEFSEEVFRAVESRLFNNIDLEMSPQLTKPSSTQPSVNWERNQLVKNSPVVILPTQNDDTSNSTLQRVKHLNWSDRVDKNKSSEATHVTTSSPTEKRHLQPNSHIESKPKFSQNRPVPPPRTVITPHSLMVSSDQHASMSYKNLQPQRANILAPPVPKKRQSLAYSRSLSSAGDFEKKLEPAQESLFGDIKKLNNNAKLARTQSCESSSTLQRRQNAELASATDSKYEDVSDAHVYEDLDRENQENIYEVCEDVRSDKYNQSGHSSKGGENKKTKFSELDKWLTPLRKIKLETSPGQQRRNRPGELASVHNGLAYSLDELADLFAEKRCHFYDNDDNSSIADDEMSLSNEEDMDDRLRQHSLRRCVSADNLLRSGSILDRSMILAKRRRRRMRERRSTSHIFTDSKHFMNLNALTNLTNFEADTNGTKARYNKRKTTSNERLFKHKASHTDSGHDSEIVSPCTSPNARRHLSILAPLSYQRPFQDLDDSNAPRQGTLPKKPWEIRLRNTQYQRKSRSRENLLTLAPKI